MDSSDEDASKGELEEERAPPPVLSPNDHAKSSHASPVPVNTAYGPSTNHYPLNQMYRLPPGVAPPLGPRVPYPYGSPLYHGQPEPFYPAVPIEPRAGPPPAQPPKAAKTKKKTATNGSSSRFKDEEIDFLLDLIEEHLPIGKAQWEEVERSYNAVYEHQGHGRLMENLRKKYNMFCKVTPPTGETEMHPHVARAKKIQEDIFDKSESTVIRGDDEEEELKDRPDGFVGAENVARVNGTENPAAALPKRKSNKRTIGGSTKKSRVHTKSDDFIEAFLATESAAAKRERKRDKRHSKQMKQMFSAIASAFLPKARGLLGMDKSDESSSSSSSSEEEKKNSSSKRRRDDSSVLETNGDQSESSSDDEDIYS